MHIGLIVRGLPDEHGRERRPMRPPGRAEVIFPRTQYRACKAMTMLCFSCRHKRLVAEVEQLFRVSATFF